MSDDLRRLRESLGGGTPPPPAPPLSAPPPSTKGSRSTRALTLLVLGGILGSLVLYATHAATMRRTDEDDDPLFQKF